MYVGKESCNNSNNTGTLIGAVVAVDCTVIIIMVITNIMVWIYCFRKRKHTGSFICIWIITLDNVMILSYIETSPELHGPNKNAINPVYLTITDDHLKKPVEEPINYYEAINRPPEVKMTPNPAYALP